MVVATKYCKFRVYKQMSVSIPPPPYFLENWVEIHSPPPSLWRLSKLLARFRDICIFLINVGYKAVPSWMLVLHGVWGVGHARGSVWYVSYFGHLYVS